MHAHTTRSVGRRKTAVARVMLVPGTGKITINNRTLENFFPLETQRADVVKPLDVFLDELRECGHVMRIAVCSG